MWLQPRHIQRRKQQVPAQAAGDTLDSQRKLMIPFTKRPMAAWQSLQRRPDILVNRCTHVMHSDGTVTAITQEDLDAIMNANRNMASQALRVLAMAYKIVDEIPEHPDPEKDERDLVFCGLAGMIDPPRPEAIEAVKLCKSAGIRTVMITGDYKETAAAIARQLGIISSDDEVLTGSELNEMSDHELDELVERVSVYARVSPEHKVRIVQSLKNKGHIAAMTGDGVNDAPAQADIGGTWALPALMLPRKS